MNLGELIKACRIRADDTVQPYLWEDDEWVLFLNEAVNEAVTRARLLINDDLVMTVYPGETRFALPDNALSVDRVYDLDKEQELSPDKWDSTRTDLVLTEPPDEPRRYQLRVTHLPAQRLANKQDVPGIPERYHYRLIDWALRCAYLKNDSEVFNPNAVAMHEQLFIQSFGEAFDANVQRKHRRNTPRAVRMNPF